MRSRLDKQRVPQWDLPPHNHDLNDQQQQEINILSRELVCQQQLSAITPVFAVLATLLSVMELDLPQLEYHFIQMNKLIGHYGTPCFIQGIFGFGFC